ncbi:MAG: DUF721 domain-containing protein [Lentisphaeria bacterium]
MTVNQDKSDNELWLDRKEHRNKSHKWRTASRRERQRENLLRDWYGEETARAMRLDRQRGTNRIGDTIDSVLQRMTPPNMFLMEQIRANWAEIVGEDNANNSSPLRLDGNRLEIEVTNPSWMYVLATMHAGKIREKIRRFTDGKVDAIRFVPAGRRGKRE